MKYESVMNLAQMKTNIRRLQQNQPSATQSRLRKEKRF